MRCTADLTDEPKVTREVWSRNGDEPRLWKHQLVFRDRDGATVHVVGTLEQLRRWNTAVDGVLYDADQFPEVTAVLRGES